MNIAVESFLPSEYIKYSEGLFNIVGGGVTHIHSPEFPANVSFHVAVRMAVFDLPELPAMSFEFNLRLEAESGTNILDSSFKPGFSIAPSGPTFQKMEYVNMPIHFPSLTIPTPGRYRLVLEWGETDIASTWVTFAYRDSN
jgi:hypothetical protein